MLVTSKNTLGHFKNVKENSEYEIQEWCDYLSHFCVDKHFLDFMVKKQHFVE